MRKLKKITEKFLGGKNKTEQGNGLYAEVAELMNMRKFTSYWQQRKQKVVNGKSGDIKSMFKGRGIEMEEIREYRFGDDVRDIDWRVTARKEAPYTKVYLEEKDREIYVWLDLSAIMLFGSSYELKTVTAAKIAALLGWVALNNNDRFGCVVFDGKESWVFKPKNDRASLMAVLKKISQETEKVLKQNFYDIDARNKSLKLLQTNIKSKAGVFIISSFGLWGDESDKEIVAIAKKSGMVVINVFDKLEEKSPPAGQYMAEYNGEKTVVDTSLKKYKKEYEKYFAEKLKNKENFCKKIGCKFVGFSADMSFGDKLRIF